jgi:hypothetical protein
MGENIPEFIKGAAYVLIAILIIGVALAFFTKGKNIIGIADQGLTDTTAKLSQSQYVEYDTGKVVTGNQVINAIRTFSSSTFTVTVVTKAGSSISYTSPTAYTVIDISNTAYIEPTALFVSTISKTSNATVNHITLIQQ